MSERSIAGRIRSSRVFLPALLLLAFGAGLALRGGGSGDPSAPEPSASAPGGAGAATEHWTCSMHPQIQLPEPGRCPLCFMDLIPVQIGAPADDGPRVLRMSAAARQLAAVRTAPVERRFVDARLRLVGKVELDETRVRTITAWVGGRLDRLFVDYTGINVRKGDHLVELYSPDLIAAQEELLQSLRAASDLERSQVASVRQSTLATVDAAREKLRLLGLRPSQIEAIEKRGTPTDRVTIYAPIGGVVLKKNATQGMYVEVGTPIYTIADLSHVWIRLDAYESDLVWLRYGQEVEFSTEAYPGEAFHGRIAFIDPVLDPRTRTVKVRVNVENPGGKLKPEMFVRATVHARVARGGRVMDANLAGKWVSPMHPEIVKDGPGRCDVCGMRLVRAEDLGYVAAEIPAEAPLVIPVTAALRTGRRAVVYVELPDREQPTYEGRDVVLGPRAGDFYLVERGLEEGERVVVNGNFKIDSALQIQGKPSMMSAATTPGVEPAPLAVTPALRRALTALFEAYFVAQTALSDDELQPARAAAESAALTIAQADTVAGRDDGDGAAAAGQRAWSRVAPTLAEAARAGADARDLAGARVAFRDWTEAMLEIEQLLGHEGPVHYTVFCPMAFDDLGALWLQTAAEVANPYFGKSMPRCGTVRDTLTAIPSP